MRNLAELAFFIALCLCPILWAVNVLGIVAPLYMDGVFASDASAHPFGVYMSLFRWQIVWLLVLSVAFVYGRKVFRRYFG